MEDGCFLAYKKVKKVTGGSGTRYFDFHTGKVEYKIGEATTMKREECNADPKQTCSRGLHVANWEYAWGFGSDDCIVECRIDPADVVAVPDDYHQQKMRCCKVFVLKIGKHNRHDEDFVKVESHLLDKSIEITVANVPAGVKKSRRTWYKLVDCKIQTVRKTVCPDGWFATREEACGVTDETTGKANKKAPVKVQRRTWYKLSGNNIVTTRRAVCPDGWSSERPRVAKSRIVIKKNRKK